MVFFTQIFTYPVLFFEERWRNRCHHSYKSLEGLFLANTSTESTVISMHRHHFLSDGLVSCLIIMMIFLVVEAKRPTRYCYHCRGESHEKDAVSDE
jgi:hypothetical protein